MIDFQAPTPAETERIRLALDRNRLRNNERDQKRAKFCKAPTRTIPTDGTEQDLLTSLSFG